MSKFTVKTELSNITQLKDGTFSYKEDIVSMKWTESKEKAKYTQSGKGPGEFGPDYSDRKKYQLGYGNESPSPQLKEFLVNTHRNPRQPPYPSHVIGEYREPIRHKSEWINAPDDGRINNPPHGVGYDPNDLKPVKRHYWDEPIKRSRKIPLTKEELEYRHEALKNANSNSNPSGTTED